MGCDSLDGVLRAQKLLESQCSDLAQTQLDKQTRGPEIVRKRKFTKVVSTEMVAFLSNFFRRVGAVVASHPLTTIYVSLAFAGLCSVGILWKLEENDPWLAKESDLYRNKIWLDRFFPQYTASESPVPNGFLQAVIVTDDNVMKPDVIKNIYEMHSRIVKSCPLYENRCIAMAEFQGLCANFSILRLWDFKEERIINLTQADINESLKKLRLREDKRYILSTLSDTWATSDNASIRGAKSVLLTWNMQAEVVPPTWYLEFESRFYDIVRDMQPKFKNLVYSGGRSFNTESKSMLRSDLKFVIYGYSFVLIYMCTQMSYDGSLSTGLLVSLSGISAVVLAMVMMFGISSLTGYFWSGIHVIIPAILLGIGIDDMFVVIQMLKNNRAGVASNLSKSYIEDPFQEFSKHSEELPMTPISWNDDEILKMTPDQMDSTANEIVQVSLSRILREVGLSIFVTSISDALAFAVGTTFIMPATSSMCVWLSIGISFIFVLMNTFFIACLALIERKRIRRRMQESRARACSESPSFFDDGDDPSPIRPQSCPSRSPDWEKPHIDKVTLVFKKFYVPFVANRKWQIVVVTTTIGIMLVCLYGMTQTELQWDIWTIIPTKSFLREFKAVAVKRFPELIRSPLQLVFRDLPFYSSMDVLNQVLASFRAFPLLTQGPDWLRGFNMYLRLAPGLYPDEILTHPVNNLTAVPESEVSFHFWLNHFLNSSLMDSANKDLVFDQNTTRMDNQTGYVYHPLKACKFIFAYKFFSKTEENRNFLDSLDRLIYHEHGISTENVFIFSELYVALEQARYLPIDLSRNLSLSLILIGFIIFILFANVQMGLMCSLAVCLSLFDVFGLLYFYGLTLEPVTAMTMVILIGLVIDFSVHLGHAYIVHPGDRPTRVAVALVAIGPAVLHGGVSTIIAMAPLTASSAYAYQAFSKLIVSMVVIGLWHGLVFLPILLHLLGPEAKIENDELENCENEAPDKGQTLKGIMNDHGERVRRKTSHVVNFGSFSKSKKRRRRRVVVKKRRCVCSCVETKKEKIVTYVGGSDTKHEDFLVVPPNYVRKWIVPTSNGSTKEDDGAIPRIPRARASRLPSTVGNEVSLVSSHPACPPTPPALIPALTGEEKDSLFNSSYHPTSAESRAPSSTDSPVDALTLASESIALDEINLPPISRPTEFVVAVESVCRLRQTSLSLSVTLPGYDAYDEISDINDSNVTVKF